jgi:iron(III) transport system substrate-binding protein
MRQIRGLGVALAFLSIGLLAGSVGAESLVLYSGRSKSLVDPLIEQFEQKTDIEVQVKYGKGAQLLATLNQEGDYSPADVFWANTVGVLGTAAKAGHLAKLPASITDIPGSFHSSSGRWVPFSARFRVLAYNSNNVDPSDLPDSVLDLPELEQYQGRVGWTPPYSSFQDFVTAMRVTEGRSTTAQWLSDMQQLNPKSYSSNTPMITAMAQGQLDIALTNHYYVHRKHGGAAGAYENSGQGEQTQQAQSGAPVKIYHFEPGDVGNLALVTGAGMLKGAENKSAAKRFLKFLLSPQAQQFAAQTVNEYPVIANVNLPDHVLSMDRVLKLSPDFEFERLNELDQTLKLLREEGLF